MSKTISIGVDMDTDKLQLKLRAIAKHVEALADELDTIDKSEVVNELVGELAKQIDKELRPKIVRA